MTHPQPLQALDEAAQLLAEPDPELARLLSRRGSAQVAALPAVVVGELVALADEGRTALVLFDGQAGSAAVRARSVVDLQGPHIGQPVTLMFERGDPALPIVTGVVRGAAGWPLAEAPAQVEVDVGGERMLVSARQQLVLRCGKASITLTRDGKVLIQGAYVSSRSTGVNHVWGGSVQLN
ncbi:DUF6484 domain-containing protein [Xenophilus arseniciresistens]|uniref:DUF6484 domain-containing protein n=1 Tax=Xenophilus arseniciresistens TaxID=1283306 RepID=A0AAE3NBS3_9BURK|nr:DUF6484 domain-containing protein [Xenophilus arseniciresistens]MDA7418771.1 DUF6484 domain-containing protein [Xenophilus arseniciresistens]